MPRRAVWCTRESCVCCRKIFHPRSSSESPSAPLQIRRRYSLSSVVLLCLLSLFLSLSLVSFLFLEGTRERERRRAIAGDKSGGPGCSTTRGHTHSLSLQFVHVCMCISFCCCCCCRILCDGDPLPASWVYVCARARGLEGMLIDMRNDVGAERGHSIRSSWFWVFPDFFPIFSKLGDFLAHWFDYIYVAIYIHAIPTTNTEKVMQRIIGDVRCSIRYIYRAEKGFLYWNFWLIRTHRYREDDDYTGLLPNLDIYLRDYFLINQCSRG